MRLLGLRWWKSPGCCWSGARSPGRAVRGWGGPASHCQEGKRRRSGKWTSSWGESLSSHHSAQDSSFCKTHLPDPLSPALWPWAQIKCREDVRAAPLTAALWRNSVSRPLTPCSRGADSPAHAPREQDLTPRLRAPLLAPHSLVHKPCTPPAPRENQAPSA